MHAQRGPGQQDFQTDRRQAEREGREFMFQVWQNEENRRILRLSCGESTAGKAVAIGTPQPKKIDKNPHGVFSIIWFTWRY